MYQETINKIKKVSAETKSAIARKSAQTLPINPSERGMSADEIKRRFYQPITDTVNSALAEIDRLVDEVNETNSQLKGNMDAFVEKSLIKEPYKINLTDKWNFNNENGMFEVVVAAEEHGITKYDEIGVDLYLLDGQGKYTSVNQYEVLSDASVRIFHETNGAGYVNIYIKREGYIESVQAVDVHRVIGISKVGVSNNYKDLDNLPNLDIMLDNEEMISKMIAGTQPVNKALNADKATNANYAATSGTADKATNAESAEKAIQDQYGVNISDGYCKQNKTYPDLKAGKASVADKAVADEDGANIKNQYAKKNGEYPDLTAGKATRAIDADSADLAKRATADSNGANIANTYATKSGEHPNMKVGQASKSEEATKAAKSTTQNITDSSDNIATTKFVQDLVVSKEDLNWKDINKTSLGSSTKDWNVNCEFDFANYDYKVKCFLSFSGASASRGVHFFFKDASGNRITGDWGALRNVYQCDGDGVYCSTAIGGGAEVADITTCTKDGVAYIELNITYDKTLSMLVVTADAISTTKSNANATGSNTFSKKILAHLSSIKAGAIQLYSYSPTWYANSSMVISRKKRS